MSHIAFQCTRITKAYQSKPFVGDIIENVFIVSEQQAPDSWEMLVELLLLMFVCSHTTCVADSYSFTIQVCEIYNQIYMSCPSMLESV